VAKAFKDAVHQRELDETGSERQERDLNVDFSFFCFFFFVGGRFYDVSMYNMYARKIRSIRKGFPSEDVSDNGSWEYQ